MFKNKKGVSFEGLMKSLLMCKVTEILTRIKPEKFEFEILFAFCTTFEKLAPNISHDTKMIRQKKEYYFIRHAIPINDTGSFHLSVFDKDMLGEIDESLSEKGKRQAAELKKIIIQLDIQRIVSSTRKRAAETAKIISDETQIPFDLRFERLVEINLGSPLIKKSRPVRMIMTGLLSKHWPEQMKKIIEQGLIFGLTIFYFLQWNRGKTTGGDPLPEIFRKIEEILKVLDSFPQKRIAIVCHAGWISFLAVKILGGSLKNFLKLSRVDNCSVTRIDSNGQGKYKLRFFAKSHESAPRIC